MIPFEVVVALPAPRGTLAQQARECLQSLRGGIALSLTFFVDATDRKTYDCQRDLLVAIARDHFAGAPPPVSVVAQAPEGARQVALEASMLASPSSEITVARRTVKSLPYTVVTARGVRQVHGGGVSSRTGAGQTAEQSREAFALMETILRLEGMTFGNVVRQWNYIEGVLELHSNGGAGEQGYQVFNDVRTLAYAESDFPAGYPAGTGIGQATGGVLLEFVAVDAPGAVRVIPLSNPKQTDAHHYSEGQLVGDSLQGMEGKSTPKFERAKLVAHAGDEFIFLSGTAAILGERSVEPGDVAAQTRTTIENIAALLGDHTLGRFRAYVKRAEEIAVVRGICEKAFGSIPALYVRADVCRDELLVEMEGSLVVSNREREASVPVREELR